MSNRKVIEELVDNITRGERGRKPILQTHLLKKTQTPFGEVWSKLLPLVHTRKLKNGELLAQWIRDKVTGKRQKFVWLGVVENSVYNPITLKFTIFYRPFVEQNSHELQRMSQLYTKQLL